MKGDRIIKKVIRPSTPTNLDISIAMYDNHYFIHEETAYSKYSVNNYETLKDVKEFTNISGIRNINGTVYYKRGTTKNMNSLLMTSILHNKDYFKKLDLIRFEEAASHKDVRDVIYLDNIGNEQKLHTSRAIKDKSIQKISYADCESFVNGVHHELYLLGVTDDKDDYVNKLNIMNDRYGGDLNERRQLVVNEFMDILTNNGKIDSLCYFHNLKYDYHLLEPYLQIKKRCIKDNQIYNVVCSYKKRKIEFRCSYKLIPFPLANFGEVFNLDKDIRKKEAIAYEYYTAENNNKIINISEYAKYLSVDDQHIFSKAVRECNTFNNSNLSFNPTEYYKDYLRLDCLVLKKGVQKFNYLIQQITQDKMSVYDCLTISSLTDKYMIKSGAYDGVYEVCGNLRAYIAKAVYGGRVCVNSKYEKQIVEGKIADYDGVSLYPSAINRLSREIGLPTGPATRFETDELYDWEDRTYSILTVQIKKVNKHQQMPFIAHKTESSINYTNTPPPEPIIIDSVTLQDYIKFHDIEYEILDGVYWDQGGNNKMGTVIQTLFNERLKYKKTNKALANTIKLMLNSAYGKTIMKKTKTCTDIIQTHTSKLVKGSWKRVEKTNLTNYVYNNFNTIKEYRQLNESTYEITRTKADDSYNRGHIGCAILSTSKRIMNEVFDVANDNGYTIYYTDTDSLHCNYDDVTKLEQKYFDRYNKVLNGANLEQFHVDFDLDGACDEIYATKSVFLGKKSYMDVLESKDTNGDTITGYHIRLKGITKEGLAHEVKKYNNNYFELYKDLASGKEIQMILNPFDKDNNSQKALFEFKDGKVSTRKSSEFIRSVKF
jgi:hypothetical protein